MFLLDTDALSELERPHPDPGFVTWLASVDWLDMHLSVITVGELWSGINQLAPGQKRRALEAMFELLPDRFFNRIIPVDRGIAIKFGEIQATEGPLPSLDTLIAATALVRRLTLVTHNTRDMARTGAAILDPWEGRAPGPTHAGRKWNG
jgi:toxin FitB